MRGKCGKCDNRISAINRVIKAYNHHYKISKGTMAKLISIINKCNNYDKAFKCFCLNYRKSRNPERMMKKCILRNKLSYTTWKMVIWPYIKHCQDDSDSDSDSCESDSSDYDSDIVIDGGNDNDGWYLVIVGIILLLIIAIVAFYMMR